MSAVTPGNSPWHEITSVLIPLSRTGRQALHKRVLDEILQNYLRDHGKSRMLRADGSYVRAFPNAGGRPSRNGVGFNVQEFFMDLAERSPLQDTIAVAVSAA